MNNQLKRLAEVIPPRAFVIPDYQRGYAWEDRHRRDLLDDLDRSILTRAFRGELVPQDPADEPASVLLERIRAERAQAPIRKSGRGARKERQT